MRRTQRYTGISHGLPSWCALGGIPVGVAIGQRLAPVSHPPNAGVDGLYIYLGGSLGAAVGFGLGWLWLHWKALLARRDASVEVVSEEHVWPPPPTHSPPTH